MKKFINTLIFAAMFCAPQISHAMTYDKVFATSCLTPKNKVELQAFNKHTLDHNFKPVHQQLLGSVAQNKPSIKKTLTSWFNAIDRLEDKYIETCIGDKYLNIIPAALMGGRIVQGIKVQLGYNQLPFLKKHLPNAPQHIAEMTDQLCPIMGIDPASVSVKFDKNRSDIAESDTVAKEIFVGKAFINSPEYQQKATLKHELSHIKHNDAASFGIAKIITPVTVTAASLGSALAITKLSQWAQRKAHQNGWKKSAQYIHTTAKHTSSILQSPWLHLIMTNMLLAKHGKFYEKRADLDMIRETKTARGLHDFFKSHIPKNSEETLFDRISTTFDVHPSSEERAKYLEPYALEESK